MYKIVELKKYDVLIPFVCQKCGACCRGYVPQIPLQELPKIAKHIGKPIDEIKQIHEKAYLSESKLDCIFLNDANQCSIYLMRPESCKLYPLDTDFGANGVACGGHKEFHRMVDAFFSHRKYAALWDRNAYKSAIRKIPDNQLPVVWKTLTKARLSHAMTMEFVRLNELQDYCMRTSA